MASSSAIIVGGSLTGLATGIAAAQLGLEVTVLEQTVGLERGGTGLGVDRELLARVVGVDPRVQGVLGELPVVRTSRETSTWSAISSWLRALALRTPRLTFREGTRVTRVTQDEHSAAAWAGDESFRADVVIGADGYRSLVRQAVDPEHPHARYGGFVLWRALLPEAALPAGMTHLRWLGGGTTPYANAARLVVYHVPGADGSYAPGERQITMAWYDASRTAWLREHSIVDEGTVRRSIDRADIDRALRADLRSAASRAWPSPARDIALTALDEDRLFGTPIAEYLPESLARGRVAILGDAAHVASPMVGHGLAMGWVDAIALREAIAERGAPDRQALARYARARLDEARRHVASSIQTTDRLLASVGVGVAGA
jgi:2-polyprenyl-6-methoxyphenol hydroxylase-like FAD-dependent oxidoreductase